MFREPRIIIKEDEIPDYEERMGNEQLFQTSWVNNYK